MGALSNVITRIKALITADNKQFKKTMKDTSNETKKTAKKVSGSSKGMATAVKAAATGIAAVIAGKIIKSLHSLAREMGLMDLKANAVFGAYRKEVDMMAKDTATSMGLTETQFINAAAGIQDLLIPIGFARKEATKMTTETMKLAGAMSAWTGGMYDAEEVGQIFSKAVLGEREQLKSLGIAISEAEVKTRLLEKGQKGLTGQALAQAKAQATLELITEKSTDAQVAFAEGQDNIVIKSAQVKANIRGMAENITKILAPALEEGTSLLADMTSELKTLLDDAALIAQSDVLTTWEKWQYRLAGLTGGAAGMVKQMEILGMAMSTTEFDAMVDELLNVGGTFEEVEKLLEQFGEKAVKHGQDYYEKAKKLRDKDAQETLKKEEETQETRLKKQQEFYWAWEGQMMAHQKAVKGMVDDGFATQGDVMKGLNAGMETYHNNLGTLMEMYPLMLPMTQAQTEAFYAQQEAMEKNQDLAERMAKFFGEGLAVAVTAFSDAMIDAASDSQKSLQAMAKAAVNAARKVIIAYIAQGIAAQVASALEEIPFPFGLIAAALAGAAAAAILGAVIPSFAEGGVTTGPTLAIVGDNPSGREAMIPSELWDSMGGGGQQVEVYGRLRGDTMLIQNQRTQDKMRRTGRM